MVTKAKLTDREFWSKVCQREVDEQEALEMKENWVRVVKLLVEQARLLERQKLEAINGENA